MKTELNLRWKKDGEFETSNDGDGSWWVEESCIESTQKPKPEVLSEGGEGGHPTLSPECKPISFQPLSASLFAKLVSRSSVCVCVCARVCVCERVCA